jgi:hypothetical protein
MELPEVKPPQVLFQEAPATQTKTTSTAQTKITPTAQTKTTSTAQTKTTSTAQTKITPTTVEDNSSKAVQPGKEKPVVTASNEKDGDFARLTKEWKRIKIAVKNIDKPLEAALNSCKPREIKNGVLTLGCDSEFVLNLISRSNNIEIVEKAIYDTLELNLKIKSVISKTSQDTPADIKQDGMVAEAIKIGGKISDIHD